MPTKNDDFDWLTYESVFNKSQFRKPNKKFDIGLYAIPRKDVTVFFRNDLDAKIVEALSDAFFPDVEADEHLKQSNAAWEWKKEIGVIAIAAVTPMDLSLTANRTANKIHDDTYVVLPYNHYDNILASKALGTKQDTYSLERLKDDYKWEMWKTASRSCGMRLKRVKPKADPDWNKYFARPWIAWNFAEGNAYRPFVPPDTVEATRYQLSAKTNMDFSVKTGVIFVGAENQQSGEKDCLDANWIVACLRSDYVAEVDKTMKTKGRDKPNDDPDIIILTELLSINETTERAEGKLDGVQVRDLSPLDTSKIYLAPLNVPFVDLNFNLYNEEFARLKDKDKTWCDFWKLNWAKKLGRAKALFMLRYGLQHINPNPQNYLIELKKGDAGKPEPTGRIVIRDLQDAAIHREVVWALYGEAELPPDGKDKYTELKKLKLPVLSYEFEKMEYDPSDGDYPQETGATNSQFGPTGTQFLWQRFSAFTNANKIKNNETFKPFWQELMAVMGEWGKSHNREYVRCVESQLGINFFIDWDSIFDPGRLRTLGETAFPGYEGFEYQYPSEPTDDSPIISGVSVSDWDKTVPIQALTESERQRLDELKKEEAVYENSKKSMQGIEDNIKGLQTAIIQNPQKLSEKKAELEQLSLQPPPTKIALKMQHKLKLDALEEAVKDLETEAVTNSEKLKIEKAGLEKIEKQLLEFESKKGEYDGLTKKLDDFSRANGFDDLKKGEFIVISGKNFQEGATVKIGGEEADKVICTTAEQLYVKAASMEAVNKAGKSAVPITVMNPPPTNKLFKLDFKPTTDLSWEEVTAQVVHDYLKSEDGQKSIRDYRDRVWKPVKPVFRITILDEADKPIFEHPVKIFYKAKAKTWTDITDLNGEITIYQGKPDDYQVMIKGYRELYGGWFEVADIKKLRASKLDFEYLEVLYSE